VALTAFVGAIMPGLVIWLKMRSDTKKRMANGAALEKNIVTKVQDLGSDVKKIREDVKQLKYWHKHQQAITRIRTDIPTFADKLLSDQPKKIKSTAKIGAVKASEVFVTILELDFELTYEEIYEMLYLKAKSIEHLAEKKSCLRQDFKNLFRKFAVDVSQIPESYNNGERSKAFRGLCYELTSNLINTTIKCTDTRQ
jgi:hypothetical protein